MIRPYAEAVITLSGSVRDGRQRTIYWAVRAMHVTGAECLSIAVDLALLAAPGTILRVGVPRSAGGEYAGDWEVSVTRAMQLEIAKRLDTERAARIPARSYEEAAR